MTKCATCIITDVANAFGIMPAELAGQSRDRHYSYPRFAAYRLMRERGLSYTVIGRMIGHRDHSTILAGVRRADALLKEDPKFAELYEAAR